MPSPIPPLLDDADAQLLALALAELALRRPGWTQTITRIATALGAAGPFEDLRQIRVGALPSASSVDAVLDYLQGIVDAATIEDAFTAGYNCTWSARGWSFESRFKPGAPAEALAAWKDTRTCAGCGAIASACAAYRRDGQVCCPDCDHQKKRPPVDTCPVHVGVPEPCPECQGKIAGGL